jgi:hypothetical protein
LRFRADTSATTIPQLVAGRVCQRDVNVAVCFNFQSNDAASEREPLIFSRDAFLLIAL